MAIWNLRDIRLRTVKGYFCYRICRRKNVVLDEKQQTLWYDKIRFRQLGKQKKAVKDT